MIDRRAFLAAAPFSVLAAGCLGRGQSDERATGSEEMESGEATSGSGPGLLEAHALTAVGVQLYTLRDAIAADLDGALGALAEIGYQEVELFQLHGLTARELRERLDAHGLRAASSHYGLPLLRHELDATIDGALALGQHLMVVPSLSDSERTADGLARVADDFNRVGEAVRGAGMRFGYHNHDWELRPLESGARPIDLLLDRTDPDLVDWQMDIFWTVQGGADPMAELERRAGRVTSVHVKDRTTEGEMVDVGDGVIDFVNLLGAAGGQGLAHAFVEHDNPVDAIESVRRSFRYLRSMGVAR